MIRKIQAITIGLLLLVAGTAQAELAIIAHPTLKLVGISQDELRDIYLGRTRTLSNGTAVDPVDQEASSEARKKFVGEILQMSEQALKSHWAKRTFAGKGKAPETVGDDEAVKSWVAANPNGLGYVQGKYVDKSVKVLLIIP